MNEGGRVVWYFDANTDGFYRGVDNVRTAAKSAATSLDTVDKSAKTALSGLAKTAQDIGKEFNNATAAVSLIGDQFQIAGGQIANIASYIGQNLADLGTYFGTIVSNAAQEAYNSIAEFTSGLVDTIVNTDAVQGALGALSQAYESLTDVIGSVVGTIQGYFQQVQNFANGVANRVQSVLNSVGNAVQTTANQIGNFFSTQVQKATTAIQGFGTRVSDVAQRMVQPIVQSRAFGVAMDGAAKVATGFRTSVDYLGNAATVVGGRIAALSPMFGRLASAIAPIGGLVAAAAGSLGRMGLSAAQAGLQGLSTAFQKAGSAAVTAAGHVARFTAEAAKVSFKGLENAAAGALAVVGGLGVKGIQSANQLQSLQLSMNGLTKSMDLGAKAMAGAYEYAQRAPFQLPDVAGTTKTLLAFGQTVDQAVGNLELLGNVSITSGIPLQSIGAIFGRVSAQGRLMGGDIQQLTENGIAVLPALQKQLGKTADQVRAMASDGQISADQFRTALSSLVDPTILDQLNNTMPRQIDRLQGSLRQLSNAFVGVSVDATNGFKMATGGLAQAATTLTKTLADTIRSPELKDSFAQLGNALVPLVNALNTAIPVIASGIAKITEFIAGLGAGILPVLGLAAAGLSGFAAQIPIVGSLLGGLTGPVGLIIGLLAAIIAVSQPLQDAFKQVFVIIGDVFKQLAPVFAELGSLFGQIAQQLGGALAPLVIALAKAFGEILKAVIPILPVLGKLVLDIIQKVLVPIIPFVVQFIGLLASVFSTLLVAITPVLGALGQLIVTVLQAILVPLMPVIIQLVTIFAQVLNQVFVAVAPLLPQIIGLVTLLIGALAPILPQLADLFIQLIVALLPLLPPLIQLLTLILPPLITIITVLANVLSGVLLIAIQIIIGILNVIIAVFSVVVSAIVHVLNFFVRLANIGAVQFDNLKNAVGDSIGKVVDFVRQIPEKIKSFFSNAGDFLRDAGKKIIDGLVNGIKDKFGDVKKTLNDLTGKLTSWKGPESLDKKILSPSGNMVIDGFIKGLESSYGNVRASLKGFTNSLATDVNLGVNASANMYNDQPVMANLSASDFEGMTGNSSSIVNNINEIKISDEVDAENWLQKLTRQDEVTRTGLTANV